MISKDTIQKLNDNLIQMRTTVLGLNLLLVITSWIPLIDATSFINIHLENGQLVSDRKVDKSKHFLRHYSALNNFDPQEGDIEGFA